ncbi:MAG: hypothetical protein J2O49_02965 [Sciscionella sp.]|nr:hypothetical protein [Sciscionella sp.]
MTDMAELTRELGVRLFTQEPADFDPKTADERQLRIYGYPPRPDAKREPVLHDQWMRRVGRGYQRIQPEFTLNKNKRHEPLHGAAEKSFGAGTQNATSTNWSGSVVFAPSGKMFTWLEGQWDVPDPDVPKGASSSGSYYSSAWVGIDGWGSGDVLQAGTESESIGGTKHVYAWWEWYPNYEVGISNFPVSSGDTLYCLICAGSNLTSATIFLTNDNSGQQTSFNITAPSGTTLKGNCAEWIVETPTVGGSGTTLPAYGTVYFDEALAALSNNGGLADGFTGTPVTLVDSSNNPQSTPTLEKSHLVKLSYKGIS